MERQCGQCGKKFTSEKFKLCDSCRAYQREYQHNWKAAKMERIKDVQYICNECFKEFDDVGYKTCPSCREKRKKYREANKEQLRRNSRKFWWAHHEEQLARARKYREAHIEERRAYCRAYMVAHKEEKKAYHKVFRKTSEWYKNYTKKWRLQNPHKRCRYEHSRRANKAKSKGHYTDEELTKLFEKQDGKCFYCRKLLFSSFDRVYHIDHKVPLSRGGENDISNIALACAHCNLTKHNKTADEFIHKLGVEV